MNSPPILEPVLVGIESDVHWGLTDLASEHLGNPLSACKSFVTAQASGFAVRLLIGVLRSAGVPFFLARSIALPAINMKHDVRGVLDQFPCTPNPCQGPTMVVVGTHFTLLLIVV